MPIPDLTERGYLPQGRYLCTLDEVRKQFGWNEHRIQLLRDLKSYLIVWEQVLPLSRLWIGGSFLTQKEKPGDIDVTAIVREKYVSTEEEQRFLSNMLSLPGPRFKKATGLSIDQYPFVWSEYSDVPTEESHVNYVRSRGYWDDWWGRERSTGAEQVRGYLEVILDENE